MKKIVEGAMDRLLALKFHQWKANIDIKGKKQEAIEDLMKMIARRQKRQGFNKYKARTQEHKQHEINERRVTDIRFKLREKLRKRIFKAIKGFSYNHRSAKNCMRRLITRLDHSMKMNSFKKWLKVRQFKDEK